MDTRSSTAIATGLSVSILSVPAGSRDSYDSSDRAVTSDSSLTVRRRRRLNLAEGALALIMLYALIGAGIGAAADSLLLGLVVGIATGVAAIAAILLISGASSGAERNVDRVISRFPRQVPR